MRNEPVCPTELSSVKDLVEKQGWKEIYWNNRSRAAGSPGPSPTPCNLPEKSQSFIFWKYCAAPNLRIPNAAGRAGVEKVNKWKSELLTLFFFPQSACRVPTYCLAASLANSPLEEVTGPREWPWCTDICFQSKFLLKCKVMTLYRKTGANIHTPEERRWFSFSNSANICLSWQQPRPCAIKGISR